MGKLNGRFFGFCSNCECLKLAEPVAFAIPIREISAANSLSTWLSD